MVEFLSEWASHSEKILNYWLNFLLLVCWDFKKFLLELILVIWVFIGIFPFHLSCLICWHEDIYNFCRIDNDVSFFILDFDSSCLFSLWFIYWKIYQFSDLLNKPTFVSLIVTIVLFSVSLISSLIFIISPFCLSHV